MTPTEISEHAKEAKQWAITEFAQGRRRTEQEMIQHGIYLATAAKDRALYAYEQRVKAKDKRIAELEAACLRNAKRDGSWIDECGSCRVCGGEIPHGHSDDCDYYKQERQLQSKDREIERLKEVVDKKERELLGFSQELDDFESETGDLENQLTEANAKLAEAKQEASRRDDGSGWYAFHGAHEISQAEGLKAQLSSAQAEIERLKGPTIVCPFCQESDFDHEGLKHHFLAGNCRVYDATVFV